MRFTILFSILMIFALPVTAQSVYSCGPVEGYDVETYDPDTHDMCDIYMRQLEYRKERLRLKDQLEARRESYAIARRSALANYERELAKLNAERSQTAPTKLTKPAHAHAMSPFGEMTDAQTQNMMDVAETHITHYESQQDTLHKVTSGFYK